MRATFRGGIYPPDKKALTGDCKFSNLSIPSKCYMPLHQHVGAPAKPVVAVGDMVKEGQLIGAADGPVSANVHSSIPGKVVAIQDVPTVYGIQPALVVEMEGSLSASALPREKSDWEKMSVDEILGRVRDAGIVGLGGIAYPTAAKLTTPQGKKIDTLIVNGAEGEPYLTADDMLMRAFPSEIIEGVLITQKILGGATAIVGVSDNKPRALKVLQEAAKSAGVSEEIQVRPVKSKYPQGAEKQLIYSLLKKKVPSRGMPSDIGVASLNVGTVYSIREAVLFRKPLFERYITISGDMIKRPGNYKVRLGTIVSDIIEECGGLTGTPEKIVIGGPMCGTSIDSRNVPVMKGTTGILFLSKKETGSQGYGACIRCGRCVAACPANLMPCDLGKLIESGRDDLAEELSVTDCILCGSCSYACPAKRPLGHMIRLTQEKLSLNI